MTWLLNVKQLLMKIVLRVDIKNLAIHTKRYIDVWATEEVNNGQPQYRTASRKWEINQTQTLNQ